MFALSMGRSSYAQTERLISYRFYQDAASAKLLSPTNKYDISEFETIEVDCMLDQSSLVQINVFTRNDSLYFIPAHIIYNRADGQVKETIPFNGFAFKRSDSKFIKGNNGKIIVSDATTEIQIQKKHKMFSFYDFPNKQITIISAHDMNEDGNNLLGSLLGTLDEESVRWANGPTDFNELFDRTSRFIELFFKKRN